MEDKKEETLVVDTMSSDSAEDLLKGMKGEFALQVLRNPKQIKADRGLAIVEETQLVYRRTIEDIDMNINKMNRTKRAMTDLSPADKTSLNFADFNSLDFVKRHSDLAMAIRQEKIKLNSAKQEYNTLFGHIYELEKLDY